MSIELLTILLFGSMVLVLLLGLPLAFATGGLAGIFAILLWGPEGFMLITLRVWDLMTSFVLIAVPMFVFMGLILDRAGIAADLYETLYQWIGRVRGGLAIATVATCTILAAMVGIAGASVVAVGIVALPSMLKHRYEKRLALGSIVAGGTLGQLIPPSVTFILYGLVAGVSVGGLFLGGVGPGLLLAALFIVYIVVRSHLQPHLVSIPSKEEMLPLRVKLTLTKHLIAPVLLIVVVMGSIFTGAATPSEAATVGVVGALICAAIRRRLTWKMLKEVGYETTKITCMIMWLIFGASALAGVYILGGGADFIEEVMLGLGLGPWGTLIVMQIIFIVLGMFIDWIAILMLTMPVFVPLIAELGFDPLWFGILFTINTQIAFLSPPFGLSCFYMKAVSPPEITIGDIYRSVWPFIIIQMIVLGLVMIFPQIGLWLPHLLLE